jgi:hypothetical protein
MQEGAGSWGQKDDEGGKKETTNMAVHARGLHTNTNTARAERYYDGIIVLDFSARTTTTNEVERERMPERLPMRTVEFPMPHCSNEITEYKALGNM